MLSDVLHVLQTGCRWCDVPLEYGPATTVHNRRSRRGVWRRMFERPVVSGEVPAGPMPDSTHVKAHRSAAGAKRGERRQAASVPRGGRTSKVHRLADDRGRPPQRD